MYWTSENLNSKMCLIRILRYEYKIYKAVNFKFINLSLKFYLVKNIALKVCNIGKWVKELCSFMYKNIK